MIDDATTLYKYNFSSYKNNTSIGIHDQNSFDNIDPHFKSTTDLHLDSAYAPQYGLLMPDLLYDIDGDPRCPYATNLGADQSRYPLPKPKASFTSSTTDTFCLTSNVTFTNKTTNFLAGKYSWFVDSVFESNSTNFTKTFSTPGPHLVTLVAINCGGSDTFSKIVVPKKVIAKFTSTGKRNVIVGVDQIQFTNASLCGIDSVRWKITPSSFKVTGGVYPGSTFVKTYFTDTGYYIISLKACKGGVCDTFTRTQYVYARDSVKVELIGPDTAYYYYCANYKDSGAVYTALSGHPVVPLPDSTNFDSTKSGTYFWQYRAYNPASGNIVSATRVIVLDILPPLVTVIGNRYDTMSVHTSYIEKGCFAIDNVEGILPYTIIGSVDTSKLGTYRLDYYASSLCASDSDFRYVTVVDDTAPQIALIGQDTLSIEVYNSFTDQGVTISDNYWPANTLIFQKSGTVDTAKLGTYKITYCVTDSSGNGPVCASRVVIVEDLTAPVITLLGADTINLTSGDTISDAWLIDSVMVTDNYYKGLQPTISGTYFSNYLPDIISKPLGCFTILYNAEDSSSNIATEKKRIVCFGPSSVEEIERNDIRVYPNPSSGHLTIESSEPLREVNVFDLQGKLLKSENLKYCTACSLNLSDIPAGIYLLKVISSSGVRMERVVLE